MTTNRIIVLDEVLASKIAAGEVVERPASVVKELVENSIDSGASRIEIEIHNGGKSLIRVTDNGTGMNKDEARLSLERHATSKIKNIDDLFNISTLGFRGEALPSIASVSRLELLTCSEDVPSDQSPVTGHRTLATKIIIEGGKFIEQKDSSAPKGTTIIVKDLFFNTPARLKFLKSDQTELSHISDIVSKLMISKPHIAFKLSHNGKEILASSGNGELRDAIASVYGSSLASSLIKVALNPLILSLRERRIHISGLISKPSETKINREYQLFFVNGRFVKNFLLSQALESAYSNLIPKDRKPAGIVFIEIDPCDVDVNVHPAKKEIKFARPKEVISSLSEIARETLIDTETPKLISSSDDLFKRVVIDGNLVWQDDFVGAGFKPALTTEILDFSIDADAQRQISSAPSCGQTVPRQARDNAVCPNNILQLDNTYLVCIKDNDLLVIDQHAAHERIIYEKLKKNITRENKQILLIPEVVNLNANESIAVKENLELINDTGFDIEDFGGNSFRIRAVPSDATKIDAKSSLIDIAAELMADGSPKDIETKKDRIIKTVACKAAVKAGDRLNQEEMNGLVKELYSSSNPTTCPHGRPSVVKFELHKLAKLFDRNK